VAVVAGSGWGLTGNPFFCAGVGGAGVVLFSLFGKVHGTIHRPGTHPRLEAQPWFAFLERHHYIHHVDTEANENFLVPLADWLFGTLRRSITDQERAAVEARRGWPEDRREPA
jgi:sterol desaturase/sphingolipid hydroxylase (fatty acid hydroxylase superfamily)